MDKLNNNQNGAAAAAALAAEIPKSRLDTSRWWRHKNLRALNLLMLIPLLSIYAQGQVLQIPTFLLTTRLQGALFG